MTPERWQEVRKVLDSVLELPLEQRTGYLDRSCSEDPTLRREVESLISSYDKAGSFLESPVQKSTGGEASSGARDDSWVGRCVGAWKVMDKLGEGGMGVVYKAEDTKLSRHVALKFLREDLAKDRQALDRFRREARAASALNHPNICTIHEVDECEGRPFIAMELIEGQTLRTISAGPLPWSKTAELGVQIVKALAAAHAAGIVHRDIKPENLMVRSDGYVKVLDFGLARLVHRLGDSTSGGLGSSAKPNTDSGTLLGTVGYMSPEQVRGEELRSASDIFSLGVVLYEMATGQHPFRSESPVATLHAILSRPPLAPSRINLEVPPQAESLILRMLEKDARLRPSAAAVEQALGSVLGGVTRTIAPPSKRHTVGREKERAELLAAFEEVAGGRGLLVCVSGEPGIGKTTLVEDFLGDLQTGGWSFSVAKGRCSERLAGAEAYLPFLEALESLPRSGVEGAAHKMRTLAPTWYAQLFPLSESDPSDARLLTQARTTTQERVKHELGAFLEEVARPEPVVLFLDDLHWADASTVDLLGYLATKFDTTRILIIGAYRPSDLFLAKHPFIGVKRDLQARGGCREIDVDFLSTEHVEHYLTLEFPENCFPREFAGVVQSRTEGNPLFMVDLLRYLRDRKVIVKSEGDGGWRLAQSLPDLSRDLPQSVKSMIERKIEQLSARDREVLAAAAVEGYEFDSASVARAMQADGLEIEERLKVLDHVHAFVKRIAEEEFPDGTLALRYRFVHVLYQNEFYASLSPSRRTALSAALARALEALHGQKSSAIASQLGFLYETARDFARASDYFRLAAQNAARIFANEEAISLSRRGLALLAKLPESPERTRTELELQVTLAFAVQVTRGFAAEETRANMARAQELCQGLGDTAQLFPVIFSFFAHYLSKADTKSAREAAEQLLSMARSANDSLLLVGAHSALGIVLNHQGEIVSAQAHFEELSKHYDPAKHASYVQFYRLDPGVYARSEGVRTLWLLGYPEQACRQLEETLALARSLSSPQSLAFGLMFGAYHYQNLRQPEKTKEIAEACIALCNAQGIPLERAWAQGAYGWAMAELGQVEEGISQIRASLELQVSIGAEVAHPQFRAILAEVFWREGRIEEGLKSVEAGLGASRRHGERYYDAELWRLRGELLKLQGEVHEADSCFQQAIELAREQAVKSLELRAATSLARLWLQQGKRNEAHQRLGDIYAWFTEGFDTADLREAKTLLKELSNVSAAS